MSMRTFLFCLFVSVLLMLVGGFALNRLPVPAVTGWSLVGLGMMLAALSVARSSVLARLGKGELLTESA